MAKTSANLIGSHPNEYLIGASLSTNEHPLTEQSNILDKLTHQNREKKEIEKYFFFQGKAWLEFEEHATAYRAMEAIGNAEVMHMGCPIAVQL